MSLTPTPPTHGHDPLPPPLPVTPVQVPKPFYKSRTFWVNIVTLAVAFIGLATRSFDLTTTDMQWLVFFQSALNVILRFLTNQPINLSGKIPEQHGQ